MDEDQKQKDAIDVIHAHNRELSLERVEVISRELRTGLTFMENFRKSVSVFGGTKLLEGNKHYEKARSIAHRIVSELGYAVVTGGGPGIMEAANRGARDAEGTSIGFTIKLDQKQKTNNYVTDELSFEYFITRKMMLSYSAEAFLFFPGGYGTLDELFEMLTLIETHKLMQIPVILVGSDYWNEIAKFLKETLHIRYGTITEDDLNLLRIIDDENEIIEIIRNAPIRD